MQPTQAPRWKLNTSDVFVLTVHLIVGIIQTYLVGAKIEYPMYAVPIQVLAGLLGQLVF